MVELQNAYPPLNDIEAMICGAQDYVRASDDLRPRVLELARVEQRERQARGWLSLAALLSLAAMQMLMSLVRAAAGDGAGVEGSRLPMQAFSRAESSAPSSDPSWQMVESFTQLRKIQAELLRL
jgi:hypothetical protein